MGAYRMQWVKSRRDARALLGVVHCLATGDRVAVRAASAYLLSAQAFCSAIVIVLYEVVFHALLRVFTPSLGVLFGHFNSFLNPLQV